MTGTGWAIAITYTATTLLALAVLALVLLSTRRGKRERGRFAPVKRLEAGEKWWAVSAAALLLVLLAATLPGVPWFADDDADRVIGVRALQFAFVLDPPQSQVRVDEKVQFRMTSDDVSHAFGLYEPDGRLVMNVQIPPGVETVESHVMREPGTYTIRCMEFCGASHAVMVGRLEVTR